MSAKRSRPKFRAGQVVYVRSVGYGRLVTPRGYNSLQFSVPGSGTLFNDEGYTYLQGCKESWAHVSELRPLTSREIGPRRKNVR